MTKQTAFLNSNTISKLRSIEYRLSFIISICLGAQQYNITGLH